MIEDLTDKERAVMDMLIQGQNCRIITEWLCIDYPSYNSIRKSILKKLKINKITQLTRFAIESNYFF